MKYFLSENRAKDFGVILGNVDDQLISPLIPTIANQYIQPRLGTYFYKELLLKYNNKTLNVDETSLVEIIQNSMVWRLCEDLIITSSSQLTNKGPQVQYGDYSQASDTSRIGLLSNHYRQKAEHFEAELINFLHYNKEKFSDYTNALNNDCRIFYTPDHGDDLFKGGIYLL
jgi:hypothetical protein